MSIDGILESLNFRFERVHHCQKCNLLTRDRVKITSEKRLSFHSSSEKYLGNLERALPVLPFFFAKLVALAQKNHSKKENKIKIGSKSTEYQ